MLNMPESLAAYFDLAPDATVAELSAAFTDDAVVSDEARRHRGILAIRDWRAETMERTPFTARPLSVEQLDDVLVVPAEVTGSFPGSPLTLTHRFVLRDGRIATLEIG
ncbi:nuclear transport factor 2 family protein [Aurantimonas sp. 22II-16-19i]|uniref:nuclear transport factor 2 family protein n=1 Tax=Aurantimonas sp. 22II-16-19i TaxID=1317114 RepID=UPI0009F7B31A|nr:nuclear transport factor 2 family protein [Aurantimonas sp. 22II-16-19i]ORE90338.1 hypothetical protein ATO4_21452 [Aurantimonas sp. 22II-16-19i]